MLSLKLIKNDWVNTIFFTFLKKIMEKAVEIVVYSTKSGVIVKAARGRVFGLLRFLRSHVLCQYKSLIDIITYDNPQTKYRFAVIYNLLSVAFNSRLLICTYTKKGLIPSVCSLYASAGWLEREAWDLYGVSFVNHPDLRRILTDYGFNHHPLRKDFPLSGYKEIFYSEKEKRVLRGNVELSQFYRVFLFKSLWKNK